MTSYAVDHPAVLALAATGLIVLIVAATSLSTKRSTAVAAHHAVANLVFAIYLMSLATVILWPFPSIDPSICSVASLRGDPEYQPLKFVTDAYADLQQGWAVSAFAVVGEAMANVVLFLPAGLYLSIVRRWRVGAVVIGCAALSALVETTQLTGVWGAYPCAYRIFSVDDLITNTAAAPMAYLVGRLVTGGPRPRGPRAIVEPRTASGRGGRRVR